MIINVCPLSEQECLPLYWVSVLAAELRQWLVYAFLYVVIETTVLSKVVAISWYTSNLFSELNGLAGSSLQRTTKEARKDGW